MQVGTPLTAVPFDCSSYDPWTPFFPLFTLNFPQTNSWAKEYYCYTFSPSDSNNDDLTFHVATYILLQRCDNFLRSRDNFVLCAVKLGWEACKTFTAVQAGREMSGSIVRCPVLIFTLFPARNEIFLLYPVTTLRRGWTYDREHTHTHTHTPEDYYNPPCSG